MIDQTDIVSLAQGPKVLCSIAVATLIILIEWWKSGERPSRLDKFVIAVLGGVATIESAQIMTIAVTGNDLELGTLAPFRVMLFVGGLAVLWVTLITPFMRETQSESSSI